MWSKSREVSSGRLPFSLLDARTTANYQQTKRLVRLEFFGY
jgi:hypothetical protein